MLHLSLNIIIHPIDLSPSRLISESCTSISAYLRSTLPLPIKFEAGRNGAVHPTATKAKKHLYRWRAVQRQNNLDFRSRKVLSRSFKHNLGSLHGRKLFVLEEVARKVLLDCGCTGKTVSDSKSQALRLQTIILQAQSEAEDAIKDLWFISDRSGLDTIVYARLYAGESEAEQLMETKQWREMEHALQNSLIIVCEPVVPWLEEDGLRLMPKDRSARAELVFKIHGLFCDFLNRLGFRYVILPKKLTSLDARVHLS